MINNRQQSGRRRGRGGQRQNGNNTGRGPEMGNRIDNRARGNAPQLLEKYKTLARDAQQAGDRVLAEYYLQFADHYFRVLAENRARFEEANPRARQERLDAEGEAFDNEDGDGEEGDEFDVPREARPQQAPQRQYRDDRNDRNDRQDRPQRDDRPNSNYNGNNNRDDRPQQRDDRPVRNDRVESAPRAQRDDRPVRESRPPREDRPREDRPRDDRPRDDRPREDTRERVAQHPRANGNGAHHDDHDDVETSLPFDALPPSISASMEPVAGVEGEPVAVPKRRGRPRKVVAEAATEE